MPRGYAGINAVSSLIEQYEQNVAHCAIGMLQARGHTFQRNLSCLFQRISVRTGADGGKADGADAVPLGQIQTRAITVRQLLGFAVPPIAVHGSHSVKNVLRGERPSAGCNSASGATSARTRSNAIQLAHNGRAARAMNGAIHPASAMQTGIRRINDGIHAHLGDVAHHQPELLPVRKIDLHTRNRTADAIVKVETIRRTRAF